MDLVIGGTKVRLIRGDITDQETDALVNAANSTLMGGGGVDGAIHRRGGPKILEECKRVMTSGGNLKARYVIHTVGHRCIRLSDRKGKPDRFGNRKGVPGERR